MNPVDPNSSLRGPRPDTDAGTQRTGSAERAGQTAVDGAPRSAPAAGDDSVSITRAAEDLLALETQLRDLPGVDASRVDQIRRAIDEGRYDVDPQRIVDGLLQSESDLG